MKKILVTTLVACALVTSALAQGQITFSAGSTPTPNFVQWSTDGKTFTKVAGGTPAQIPGYGNFNLILYGAPVGTPLSLVGGIPDLTAWKPATGIITASGVVSPILQTVGPAAGGVTGKIFQMDGTVLNAAGELQLEVVAWTGNFATFADASKGGALLAWTGDALSGGALGWKSSSGSATSPFVIDKGTGAFNGLVLAPIPEPSTFALAGLGAAALLIFRRRK